LRIAALKRSPKTCVIMLLLLSFVELKSKEKKKSIRREAIKICIRYEEIEKKYYK
jgi:hypothetical protein